MTIDWIRKYCLSLPHTTENIQWGCDLLFKIGGKMFVVAALEPGENWISLKCTLEEFALLVEKPGITPSKYLARAHWISLKTPEVLPREEIKRLVQRSYRLVFEKLPKKTQAAMSAETKRPNRRRVTSSTR